MTCHLLDFVLMKEFGEPSYQYEQRLKEYFNNTLKNATYTFKGKDVKMIYYDSDNVDEAFYKFTKGSPKYHNNTDKYDYRRLPFLPLIPIIMKDVNNCSSCDHFKIEQDKREKFKILVKCDKHTYKIVLSYNENKDIYYIVSAYREK